MIIYGLDNVTDLPENEVHLTIGNFDGVHLGHQRLIGSAVKGAKESKGISVALTFWPHPSIFFHPSSPTRTIMSAEIKNHFLEEQGLDVIVQEKFTEEFAHTSPEDFVKMLKKAFPHLTAIYAGSDFNFGYKRQGDVNFLQRIGKREGFRVVKQKSAHYQEQKISSTRIRNALEEGNIEEANIMLGYPYFSTGLVLTLSEPLSVFWNPELRPKYGIYAVKVHSTSKMKRVDGISYYGTIPTEDKELGEPNLRLYLTESNAFGPGEALKVEWMKFLYPEPIFHNREEFEKQIEEKITEAKRAFVI